MKKFISLLLCAALILTLAACGAEPEPTQPPTQPIQDVELEMDRDLRPYLGVELTMVSMASEDSPEAEVLRQAARFYEDTTGAVVEIRYLDHNEQALADELTQGGKPDIFSAWIDDLEASYSGYALDLSSMAQTADYANCSHKVLRSQVVERCGFLAGIPQIPVLYGMYYNADAFADAGITNHPNTWEDFLTMSEKLTQKGYKPLTIDIENSHLILELHLQRHLGYDGFRDIMARAVWTHDVAYLNLFLLAIQYAEDGYLAKGDPTAFPGGQDKLALSNVAMVAGSNGLCGQVEESTMMDLNWGVFSYPGDGEGKGHGAESRTLSVHKDCENPQAAFDFIMLLTRGEFDQLYADVTQGIPADPANECSIEGALKLLETADVRGFGLLTNEDQELFSRLWNGWYKTPGYFASAMNGLAKKYPAEAPEGVG